ncbi:MAG: 8-amino-7-oxononanoate synthase [Polyangiales bacterium]
MRFREQIVEALQDLETQGLLRRPRHVESAQGPEIQLDGKKVLCFCSNNYLGLADHPDLAAAARVHEGFGAAASRLITGTMSAHHETEHALAGFLGSPAAVLFANGYAANVGTIQALVGPGDIIFSDALNHASLIDGCRLSRANVRVYRHRDVAHLRELMESECNDRRRALIVTDSLFSMDGVAAPLAELAALATTHGAGLMVDEAHALGVFGPEGRGLCAAQGLEPDVLIGTLGKSFGGAGAFVGASGEVVSLIRNRARSYVYSTAPPPSIARAAHAAIALVRDASASRARLLAHAATLRTELSRLGFEVLPGESQIIPIMIGSNQRTMALSAALLDEGIFVQGIRPPTVAEGTARLRLTPMATHTDAHIDRAVAAFARLRPTR